jgi:hypothetical protein
MAHIDVGDSSTVAYRCEYYDYLEDWHLENKAPESLAATRSNLTAKAPIDYRRYFPYPLTQKYTGKGLPTKPEDVNKWVGVEVSKKKAGIV